MTPAEQLLQLLSTVAGGDVPIRLRAWDGSEAGHGTGPVLVVDDVAALRRLLWQPNELGLAQAYAAGEISVDGDLAEGLAQVWAYARTRPVRIGPLQRIRALATAAKLGAIGPRPAPPSPTASLDGELHSRDRDRAVIGYHYDLSNDFYALLLDESMAYSCAYWTSDEPGYGLADAQRDKLDLICAKLGIEPGTRLLDIGCGWGSLTLHAAQHYGARVVAVTLSAQQKAYVAAKVIARDLRHLVEVRQCDYRDVADGPYDAIATVEMGEHVGRDTYPAFAGRLFRLVRPGGRVLVQQMSRGPNAPGGGAFIEAYIAPDMHMRPVGETIALLERSGLEVRDVHALREHYALTARAWLSTLEDRWAEAVALVGEPVARIWRLYLAGGALAFTERRMGVDQILAIRPTESGLSGLPLDRDRLTPWREPR